MGLTTVQRYCAACDGNARACHVWCCEHKLVSETSGAQWVMWCLQASFVEWFSAVWESRALGRSSTWCRSLPVCRQTCRRVTWRPRQSTRQPHGCMWDPYFFAVVASRCSYQYTLSDAVDPHKLAFHWSRHHLKILWTDCYYKPQCKVRFLHSKLISVNLIRH